MNGYEAQIKELLRENGWEKIRSGKGSHEIWAKGDAEPVTVPYGCKSRHLANKILKHCKIDKKF